MLGKDLKGVSGVATTKKKNYWVSSKEYALYSSSLKGSGWRKLRFTRGRKPLNWAAEDLSLARCRKRGSEKCLFVANIGRGDKLSKAFQGDRLISFLMIPEDDIGSQVPWTEIRARYPNKQRHHAEAFAIHPITLDIYLITKKDSFVYRLKYTKWRHRTPGDFKKRFVGELEKILELKVKKITSLDFSKNGKKVFLTTAKKLILMNSDFNGRMTTIDFPDKGKVQALAISNQPNNFVVGFDQKTKFQNFDCSK